MEELFASITGWWPQVRVLHRYSLDQVKDPPLALLDRERSKPSRSPPRRCHVAP